MNLDLCDGFNVYLWIEHLDENESECILYAVFVGSEI